MSGEMRQNVSNKEIKGGGRGGRKEREPAENLSAAFSWFLVVSSCCAASRFIVPGEALHNLTCGALIFFQGCLDQNKFIFKLRKHREREEEEIE